MNDLHSPRPTTKHAARSTTSFPQSLASFLRLRSTKILSSQNAKSMIRNSPYMVRNWVCKIFSNSAIRKDTFSTRPICWWVLCLRPSSSDPDEAKECNLLAGGDMELQFRRFQEPEAWYYRQILERSKTSRQNKVIHDVPQRNPWFGETWLGRIFRIWSFFPIPLFSGHPFSYIDMPSFSVLFLINSIFYYLFRRLPVWQF